MDSYKNAIYLKFILAHVSVNQIRKIIVLFVQHTGGHPLANTIMVVRDSRNPLP